MEKDMLITKIQKPPLSPGLVQRERFYARLNEGLERKLILVSAPAGFGKTTLLRMWLSQVDCPVAWLSLDEYDNDFPRFIHYFVAALQAVYPSVGGIIPVMLQSPSQVSFDGLMTTLINDLAEQDDPLVILLDDYHLIEQDSIHQALQFLLDHMPAQLQLIISTRVDPPLALARLRAQRQIVELREADLRLSETEIESFLKSTVGIEITSSQISLLQQRTEGWVAGLQLAALSMLHSNDVATFIEDFSGSHYYIVDYLTDEVLNHQSDDLVKFLLQTCILDQMNGSLCDTLTQRDDSAHVLEELRKLNLFVIPLDEHRQWYRYHRLFADVLRQRLETSPQFELSDLHGRAGIWYTERGFLREAIHHFIAANELQHAAELLVQAVSSRTELVTLSASTLNQWIEALPPSLIQTQPHLLITQARLLTIRGDLSAANQILRDLETRYQEQDTEQAKEIIQTIVADQTSNAILSGQVRQAMEQIQQLLSAILDDDTINRMRLSSMMGTAAFQAGETGLAYQSYRQAVADARSLDIPAVTASLLIGLAETQLTCGELQLAASTLQEAANLVEQERPTASIVGPIELTSAKVLYEQNDLSEAERRLAQALSVLRKNGPAHSLILAYAWLARIKQAGGDMLAAQLAMQQANQLNQGQRGVLATLIPAFQARIWLEKGSDQLVSQWAQGYRQQETEYLREFEDLTLVRWLLRENQIEEADRLLDKVLKNAQAEKRITSQIETQILYALLYQQYGDDTRALDMLEQALSLAAPEGYQRLFLNEGQALIPLLQRLSSTPFIYRLLSVLSTGAQIDASPVADIRITFTERELQVLGLLDTELSYPEIADQLFVAPSTVRTHIKSIYSKLDAHSRFEAVVKAKNLGLL